MAVSVPFYATWDDDALRRAQRDVDGFGQGILGSIGKLEDMEGIAVYLASRQSDFMTGQAVVLDGGHTIFPL